MSHTVHFRLPRPESRRWWTAAALVVLLALALLVTQGVAAQRPADAADEVDIDGDGVVAPADCEPLNPAVHPTATDLPDLDGLDTNCDGVDGDAAKAFFVAPAGADANPGTQAQPFKTVQRAVTAATSSPTQRQVYAAMGAYPERVSLGTTSDGVGIYGGYQPGATWTRPGTSPTRIEGSPEGVILDGATDVVLQLLVIHGRQGSGSLSAYGVRAISGSEVALIDVEVTSGNGGTGSTGASGSTPSKAASGANGAQAPNCDTSGTGGAGAFQGGNGFDGGAGGRGGEETNDGENGVAGSEGGGGSPGGDGGAGGVDEAGEHETPAGVKAGKDGLPGNNGTAGNEGSGGGNDLGATGPTWSGRNGTDGTNGMGWATAAVVAAAAPAAAPGSAGAQAPVAARAGTVAPAVAEASAGAGAAVRSASTHTTPTC